MRIIHNVELHKECPRCGAVIAIEPHDVTDCAAVGTWASCPVCNNRIGLHYNEMPTYFRNQVEWDE